MNTVKMLDFVERVGATFLETFLALVITNSTSLTHLSDFKTAAVAGGLSAAKVVLIALNGFTSQAPAAAPPSPAPKPAPAPVPPPVP